LVVVRMFSGRLPAEPVRRRDVVVAGLLILGLALFAFFIVAVFVTGNNS
jgi:hypothetical protein